MLQCGAAMVEITPEAGMHLSGSGYGEYRPAEIVLDPLYAKAMVLNNGSKMFCIVTVDLTIITEQYADQIRNRVQARHNIPFADILVHAIQTHSAPSAGCFMFDPDFPSGLDEDNEFISGSTTAYSRFVADQAVRACDLAVENLQPVTVGIGRSFANHLSFNRRVVTRSGKVVMPGTWSTSTQPVGNLDLLYYEGPVDPEVSVICFRDVRMNMIAMLLHFTCHPVCLFNKTRSWNVVSADWPGAWSQEVREQCGQTCVPIVLNGCCGNINPWDPFEPDFVADHTRMGRQLMRTTDRILRTMRFQPVDVLESRTEKIPLDYRQIPQARLDQVERILSAQPRAVFTDETRQVTDTDWFLAASTRSIEYIKKRMPRFLYEVHGLRIGDAAVVGWPGEPFAEAQLELKMRSPARQIQVAHCTSQYVGYVPIAEAYPRSGHEANDSFTYWAKLAPDSLDRVVAATRTIIDHLFAAERQETKEDKE